MSGPLPLAVALFAVVALVLLTHLLGFSQRARLAGPEQAASLAQDLRGGFATSEIVLSRDGAGALLHDKRGRLAVVAPLGAHFLVREIAPGWSVLQAGPGRLAIRGDGLSVTLDLGPECGRWRTAIAALLGGAA